MELIVDANILFAALIKESTTATLLFDSRLKLYCPEFIMDEFLKYRELIQKKMRRTPEEFITIMHQLQQIIIVVPEEEYDVWMDEAQKIAPDDKDISYFALALKLNCSIWSNDAQLKKQDSRKVYTTKELVDSQNK